MRTELLSACDRWVAAGLTGVYQGIILALVAACVLRWFGRTNAATRHAVWFVMLLLVALLIPAHYYFAKPGTPRLNPVDASSNGTSQAQAELPTPETEFRSARATEASPPPSETGSEDDNREVIQAGNGHEAEAASLAPQPQRRDAPRQAQVGEPEQPGPEFVAPAGGTAAARRWVSPADEPPSASARGWRLWRVLRPAPWTLWSGTIIPRSTGLLLVLLWAAVASFRTGVLVAGLHQLRNLKRGSSPASAEAQQFFQGQCERLGVTRGVELRTSEVQKTPVLLGFRHPVIVLPAANGRSDGSGETESILRHELAHVCRGDDWANLVQSFVHAAVFFHPAAWWICRRISLEREIACDDWVLEQGCRARDYALILANLAMRRSRGSPRLATGVWTSKSELKQRINMILNTKRDKSPRLAKTRLGLITSAATVLAVLAVHAAPRLVLAQTQPASPAAGAIPVGALAAAPAATPPALLVADTAPALPTPAVEPGPKIKPDSPDETPRPPEPGAMAVAPVPPAAPEAPAAMPAPAPRPPRPARPARVPANIEERLDRLERMMEILMDRENPKRPPGGAQAWSKAGDDVLWDQRKENKEKLKHIEEDWKQQAEALKQKARAEAALASQDAKGAAREVEAVDARAKAMAEKQMREVSERQIEALQRARESLSREMEKLDRQIEKLQQDRERLDERKQRRGENKNADLLGESRDEPSDKDDEIAETPGE